MASRCWIYWKQTNIGCFFACVFANSNSLFQYVFVYGDLNKTKQKKNLFNHHKDYYITFIFVVHCPFIYSFIRLLFSQFCFLFFLQFWIKLGHLSCVCVEIIPHRYVVVVKKKNLPFRFSLFDGWNSSFWNNFNKPIIKMMMMMIYDL